MKLIKLKLLIITFPLLFIIFVLNSCGGDEEKQARSMAEIHADDGTPVMVETIATQQFTKTLSFYGKLRGIKETTIDARIGGRVEKINVSVGDRVKKDDIIVEFPVDAPSSMYEQAKTAYENSKRNFERAKALLKAGETSQANYDALESKYLVDKRNYEIQHDLIFIEAPFDGIITEIQVNEGDNVKDKTALFTVAQLHKMTTKIWASEIEIAQIKKGMTVKADFNGDIYTGKVTEVSVTADPYKQSFYAELSFNNPSLKMKSGVLSNISIITYENPDAIVIPRNIVDTDDSGKYVFLVNDQSAKKQYVKIQHESGLNYEVKEGLTPGNRLIVKGAGQLEDGTKVKVIR